MKILLCTPFEEGKEIVFGGITIWARNIMNYYSSLAKGPIQVQVQPFDRVTFVSKDMTLFQRLYFGITEYLKMIDAAKLTLKNEKYDVIHLNSSANISFFKDLLMIKVAHRFGAKIALHLHFGRVPEIIEYSNWEWKVLKMILKNADRVITMDKKSYVKLINMGYKNVSNLPNPLSQAITDQIKEEKSSVKMIPKSILYVGHADKTKGVFELAKATKGLKYSSFRIIGKCPEDTKAEMLALNPNITFVGEVSHKQVIEEMLASDIFVLPSYTEGFPNVILESMACGCATIGTSVGAIPEMLNSESSDPCGIVISPKDVDGLRHAIQSLLIDDSLCDKYRSRAINRVNDMYSVGVVWKQLTDIWEKTL